MSTWSYSYTEEDICTRRGSLCQSLKERGFTSDDLAPLFSDPRVALYPDILEKKGKGLDYFNKKFGLLTRDSVGRGKAILKSNKSVLVDIGARYQVKPEVLIAVYRVETNFGRYVGTYPVFNSLLTLSLFENRRSEWAEGELVNLLVLSRSEKIDPLSIKGSWAGAFGLCQFIPSSYLSFGADGNNDGRVDLFQFTDAMASIAKYLAGHGWASGHPEKMKKAIYAYNHCDNYVRAVLAYADAIEKPYKKTLKKPVQSRKKRKVARA